MAIQRKAINITRPLIKNHQAYPPPRGWQVSWTINNRTQPFKGGNGKSVVDGILNWCKINNVTIRPEAVWLQCNIEWMTRTPSSRHIVPIDDLYDLLKSDNLPNDIGSTVLRTKGPDRWGKRAWDWLALLTARSRFDQKQWITAIETILDLLSQEKEVDLGCSECYEHFNAFLKSPSGSRYLTLETSDEAAEWVREIHNQVNIRLRVPLFSKRKYDETHFRA